MNKKNLPQLSLTEIGMLKKGRRYREVGGKGNLNYLPPIQYKEVAILISITALNRLFFGGRDGEGSVFNFNSC